MARVYSAATLVSLPRMSALVTASLLQELLTVAAAEAAYPAVLVPYRDDLSSAHDDLAAELTKRVSAEADDPRIKAADIVEDNAVSALHGFLSSIARLPPDEHPEASKAAVIVNDLFPGGLTFLLIPTDEEWQEVETRIGIMTAKGHDVTIKALGGQMFLDHLTTAHKAYGEALGKTKVRAKIEPAVGAAREAAHESLRTYVLQVTSLVKKKDPTTQDLADRLLAPLRQLKERKHKASDAEEGTGDEASASTASTTAATSTPAAPGPAKAAAPAAAPAKAAG